MNSFKSFGTMNMIKLIGNQEIFLTYKNMTLSNGLTSNKSKYRATNTWLSEYCVMRGRGADGAPARLQLERANVVPNISLVQSIWHGFAQSIVEEFNY